MNLHVQFASEPKEGDRKPISVHVPNAYAGIASALKASYSAVAMDEQIDRLLARIK